MTEALYQRVAAHYRKRRFALFERLLTAVPRPCRILDVGGTPRFWQESGFCADNDVHITVLNVSTYPSLPPGMKSVVGNAQDLGCYQSDSFEVVHSNSVLAYVGGHAGRKRMAAEIQRVGQRFFVQTPNRDFFLDWRTATPFFHRLPVRAQARVLTRTRVGRRSRLPSLQAATDWVRQVEDVSLAEFQQLFPGARIARERFLGMTKSFVAYGGFEASPATALTTKAPAVEDCAAEFPACQKR